MKFHKFETRILMKEADVEATRSFVVVIDKKTSELRKRLHAWHGDLQSQGDIPEDFKKGVRDIEQGKVVDLDTALTNPYNGTKV